MQIPTEARQPSNHSQALTAVDNITAFLDDLKRESGGYLDRQTAAALTAQTANNIAIAQVWATLAVADAIGELDGAVQDLHETLRGAR